MGAAKYKAPVHTSPDQTVLSGLLHDKAWARLAIQPEQEQEQDKGKGKAASEKLHKEFKFRNFKEAWAFMGIVAAKAEELNHHPEWFNVYNKVAISLTTHSANSTITSLDIDLASACEAARESVIVTRPPNKEKQPAEGSSG